MQSPTRTQPLVFVTNGDPDFLLTMKQLLEDEGFTASVMPLVQGPYPEIVRMLPDLIVIDFPYHEKLAWDLIDQLDANPLTQAIPIIATSTDAANLNEFATRATVRETAEILLKPFDLDPLVSLVTAMVAISA